MDDEKKKSKLLTEHKVDIRIWNVKVLNHRFDLKFPKSEKLFHLLNVN